MKKLKRNDPCHCGSGKKYKNCHLQADLETERLARRSNMSVEEVEAGNVTPVAAEIDFGKLGMMIGAFFVLGVILGFALNVNWGIGVGGGGIAVSCAWFFLREPPPPRTDKRNPGSIDFGN